MAPLALRSSPKPVLRNGTPWTSQIRQSSPSCKKKTKSATRKKWRTTTPPVRRREEGERRKTRAFLKEQCKLLVFNCTMLVIQLRSQPRSAFMYFSMEKRPKLREENANATVGELAKMLGAAWRIMSDDQKAPYEEMTRKDRARYEEEMKSVRAGKKVVPKAKVIIPFLCHFLPSSLPLSFLSLSLPLPFSLAHMQWLILHILDVPCMFCDVYYQFFIECLLSHFSAFVVIRKWWWYMRRKRMMMMKRTKKKRMIVLTRLSNAKDNENLHVSSSPLFLVHGSTHFLPSLLTLKVIVCSLNSIYINSVFPYISHITLSTTFY